MDEKHQRGRASGFRLPEIEDLTRMISVRHIGLRRWRQRDLWRLGSADDTTKTENEKGGGNFPKAHETSRRSAFAEGNGGRRGRQSRSPWTLDLLVRTCPCT